MKEFITLGIESSCDDTSVAVVADGVRILSNLISSQLDTHARFGGVVPEIAARCHLESIRPLYEMAMDEAGMTLDDIDLVAATYGPGLVGSLLVGLSFAKGLAISRNLPLVGVNHIEGHIYANILEHPEVKPPFICLTVRRCSGITAPYFLTGEATGSLCARRTRRALSTINSIFQGKFFLYYIKSTAWL
jgi:N6-L-threonylcarbamoyladenine synthase